MRILGLELSHSKRFQLSNINHISYKPGSKFQMILGTNGSGKTSLLDEASPLAADLNKTYRKMEGAGKKITYPNYVLTSGMEYGRKHSFKHHGEELNRGGTMQVQNTLVEEHFGITQKIHDMFTNKTSFSKFSVAERKDWLTMVDKLDYEYALEEYNTQRILLRDVKGALKVAVNRATATDGLMDLVDREELIGKVMELEESIEMVQTDIQTYGSFADLADDKSKELLSDSNKRLTTLTETILDGELGMDEINEMYEDITFKRETIQTKIDSVKNELLDSKDYENIMEADINEVQNKLDDVDKELSFLDKLNTFGVEPDRIKADVKGMAILRSDILVLLDKLEKYGEINSLSPEDLEKFAKDLNYQEVLIDKHKSNVIQTETRLKYRKEHEHDDNVTCPSCDTEFKPNAEVSSVDDLTSEIERERGFLKLAEDKYQYLLRFADDISARDNVVRQIATTLGQTHLTPYVYRVNELVNYDIIDDYEPLIVGLLHVQDEMELFAPYSNLTKERERYITTINHINDSSDVLTKAELRPRPVDELETELEVLYARHDTIIMDYNRVNRERDSINQLRDEVEINRSNRKKYVHFLDRTVDSREASALKTILERLKGKMEHHQQTLRDDDKLRIEARVQEDNITNLTEEMGELEILVNALSPNKGIIGEAIMGFMNTFLAKVNKIIASMWVYDMKVLPCVVSKSGALDYKFPIQIENNEPLKDIKEGSLSIIEIIDLAFRLVSMDLLGLNQYPVFLDEFASSMDDGHRANAFALLEELGKKHSQVFMISHFVEFYGGIANMDISVLSETNILLDDIGPYNRVMTLRR